MKDSGEFLRFDSLDLPDLVFKHNLHLVNTF